MAHGIELITTLLGSVSRILVFETKRTRIQGLNYLFSCNIQIRLSTNQFKPKEPLIYSNQGTSIKDVRFLSK